MKKLEREFFQHQDVTQIARKLLGKKLLTNINDQLTGGLICETEAYDGMIDRASHAWPNKRTPRTQVLFEPGGRTYVYFCYGIHHLLNIVTGPANAPQAVLIRGVAPTVGLKVMKMRRGKSAMVGLTDGPAKVAQALGLTLLHNNIILGDAVQLEDAPNVPDSEVLITPRIGIDYAGPDKGLPWRFVWQQS